MATELTPQEAKRLLRSGEAVAIGIVRDDEARIVTMSLNGHLATVRLGPALYWAFRKERLLTLGR